MDADAAADGRRNPVESLKGPRAQTERGRTPSTDAPFPLVARERFRPRRRPSVVKAWATATTEAAVVAFCHEETEPGFLAPKLFCSFLTPSLGLLHLRFNRKTLLPRCLLHRAKPMLFKGSKMEPRRMS